jgi:small-conductance mechanosensitive channel
VTPVGADVLERAGEQLGGFLPRAGGAVLLLVVGVVVARVAGALAARALRLAGADGLAQRAGVDAVLEDARLPRPLSAAVGVALRWTIASVAALAALSLLGLQFLSEALNEAVLFLPRLVVAAALLLAGVVLGGVVRPRGDRLGAQMDLPLPLGQVAQVVVVAAFAFTAAAQLGVPTSILTGVLAVVVGAGAVTLALAFGLGGRDAARAVSAGRYVREALRPGQTITVAGVRGRITAIEPTATVLDPGDGSAVRVPNALLLESVVVVHEGEGDDPLAPPGSS